ncbi:helix-turn-helix domain-containing protein [Notoacmeibacter ruber]|uniref:AraC family transcriptional regulator n=1 Tax=Notoacmeibacter ruber TaxID=2670375 RepID=A0A3L7JDN2_9HYPH|nr:helix-turn-helix domain-containing protein [Notoacmeibacter ruber]RLQ88580.1 AraC family transcriptional regulator [Notoacmeibacter ruber]
MITLPIPLIVSLIVAYLLLRLMIKGSRLYVYWALLAACALQGLVISLVHYYGVAIRPIAPVTATFIPPLAWVAFRTSLFRTLRPKQDAAHFLAPAFTAFCVAFAPMTVDAVVIAIFVGYGVAILLVLKRQSGDLPLARIESGGVPVHVWQALAAALILSALSDGLVAVAMANDRPDLRALIVSSFSSLALLAIAALGLTSDGLGEASETFDDEPASSLPETDAEDRQMMERLDHLLRDEELYLDADLTLTRLAHRIHVPIKALSATINRHTGENVSRYVNDYRIRHACVLLRQGTPVTETIYASGFATKSNFNREFRRITGLSPSEWQGAHAAP